MKIKTFEGEHKLLEFNHYIQEIDDRQISVLELLIDTDVEELDFIEKDLGNLFAVETNKQTYLFANYEISEYYLTDEGLKVVCIH